MRKVRLPHVKAVTSKGRTYYYFDTGGTKPNGRPLLIRLPDPTTAQFGTALHQAQAARERRKPPSEVTGEISLPVLVDLYEKSEAFRKRAPATQRSYLLYLGKLAEEFDTFPASALERKDVVGLADRMADRPSAANQLVRSTGALYAWARKRGHVTIRPTDDIEMNEEGEHEPWPAELLAAALADPDPRISVPVAVLYYTGQRIGDVCKMRWGDIQPDGTTIYVSQQKSQGRTELFIPMHSALLAALASLKRNGMAIVAQEDGRPLSQKALRDRLKAWASSRGFAIVPHGLRKNAVNALLEAGCSAAQVAAITGQSLQIVEHYARRRDKTVLGQAAILKWEQRK
jgi:integrase